METVRKIPKKRSECLNTSRPCPWLRCKHHMVWCTYDIKNMTNDEILDLIFNLKETCTLDVADRGGVTLEEVGEIMGVSRERVRQIESSRLGGAIRKLRSPEKVKYLEEFRYQ